MSILFALAGPAAEQVCTSAADCANQGVANFVGTPARIWATVDTLVALVGVIIGGLTLFRSRRRNGNGLRKWAIAVVAVGLITMVNGAAILAVADGGLGTGNGVAGAVFALVLGLVAALLGWRTLARSRRTEPVS